MSLSAEEYREHLATTAVRAGFEFRDVVLPGEGDIRIGGLQMHYLDWGNKGKAADPVPARRGADRAYLGSVLPGAARRFPLPRGRSARPWRHRLGARRRLFDRGAGRRCQRLCRHLGLDNFVLVGMSMGAINALAYAINHSDRLSHLVIIDAGPEMRRPGSSRIRDFVNDVADAVSIEAIIERALQFNPRRDPNILRRSLMHNLRQQPDGSWRWKYDRSRFQRLNQEAHLAERARARRWAAGDRLPDAGRARRRERRVPRRGRRASRGAPAERPLGQDPWRRPHRAGRQPEGPCRRTAPLSGEGELEQDRVRWNQLTREPCSQFRYVKPDLRLRSLWAGQEGKRPRCVASGQGPDAPGTEKTRRTNSVPTTIDSQQSRGMISHFPDEAGFLSAFNSSMG